MSRRSLINPGDIRGTWKVIEKSDYKTSGKNQVVVLECTICGTLRSTWLSNMRQTQLKCKLCHSKSSALGKSLLHDGVTIAVYPDRLELMREGAELPTDATLYRMVSEDLGFPITLDMFKPKGKPEPDFGYEAHLAVPYDWIEFFCDEVNLDQDTMIKAMDFYNERVEQPKGLQSKHFKGSRSSWIEDGVKMGYIYWKDSRTWPKKPIEAPTTPPEPLTLPNVDPDPLATPLQVTDSPHPTPDPAAP